MCIRDRAWVVNLTFGHLAEDGRTFLVSGLMSEFEFCDAYEKASGLPIKPATLKYYEIFNTYKAIAICLGTGYRTARNGKTHQDVLVAWLCGISYLLLENLRTQLEEV